MIMNNLYIIDFTSIHYIKIEEIKSRHNTCMKIKLEETHFTNHDSFENYYYNYFFFKSIFLLNTIKKEFILQSLKDYNFTNCENKNTKSFKKYKYFLTDHLGFDIPFFLIIVDFIS